MMKGLDKKFDFRRGDVVYHWNVIKKVPVYKDVPSKSKECKNSQIKQNEL